MAESHFNILQSIGWSVLNSLWQMALLWILYQLIIGLIKSLKSHLKSFLSTLFLITGFIWFLYTFFSVLLIENKHYNGFPAIVNLENRNIFSDFLIQSLPYTSICYLVLLVIYMYQFTRNFLYVKTIGRQGLHKINIDTRIFVNNVSRLLGITRKIKIWISEYVTTPVTIGFIKPVILIPIAAINSLSVQQLEAVLLHEITHIRRNDYFINLVIQFIGTILYFNPFAKAFKNIIALEREKSCDEMVLQFQYNAHEYATALLTLERLNSSNKALAIGITGQRNMLLKRIESITRSRKKQYLNFSIYKPLIAGLAWLLSTSLLLTINRNESGVKSLQKSIIPNLVKSIYSKVNTTPVLSSTFIKKKDINTSPLFSKKSNRQKEMNQLENIIQTHTNTDIILADYVKSFLPNLKVYQEEQVKKTVEVSKTILEAGYWKSIERELGDAFNLYEKEKLKTQFHNKFKKLELESLNNKLKENYFNLDWERVNEQLLSAINQVSRDSIQNEINLALSKLENIKHNIVTGNQSIITDSVISLAEIVKAQNTLIKQMEEIKNSKKKKVVHL